MQNFCRGASEEESVLMDQPFRNLDSHLEVMEAIEGFHLKKE